MPDDSAQEIDCALEAAQLLAAAKPFDALSDAARQRLAAHARPRRFIPGELIVLEGQPGEELFFVAEGAVHVLGRGFDGTELVLARLEAGSYFGEQALLEDPPLPRNASARSVTRCRLLVLPRHALRAAFDEDDQLALRLRRAGEAQRAERRTRFRDRVLSELGIGAGYAIEHFAAGSYVFREGDPAGKIYVIVSGRALVLKGESVIKELLPGQIFGELAVLDSAPRTASVQAAEPLEVAALDGAWYRSSLDDNPRLRSVVNSLRSMYVLPARGLVSLKSTGLASHPCLIAVHQLPDGRRVLSTRVSEVQAFRAQLTDAPEATRSVRFDAEASGVHRQIHLVEDRIVELEAQGAWAGLGSAFERLVDGAVIDEDEIAAFETCGDLGAQTPPARDAAEVVCRCSGVMAAAIVSAIGAGCTSVDQLGEQTSAGLVCGGCIPTLQDFLGQGEWRPAACQSTVALSAEVRSFRLRVEADWPAALPGQHVVVQGRVRGRWVERPYTIASAPGAPGQYDLIVRREAGGVLSRWLFDQLDDGGALRLSRPRGQFCVGAEHEVNIVFLAGGIGITPALAIGRSLDALPGSWTLAVDHSVSTDDAALFRREFEALSQRHARLAFRQRVTRREGRIARSDVDAYLARYPGAEFRVCGSDGYVSAITTLLQQAGVPDGNVKVERFTPWG